MNNWYIHWLIGNETNGKYEKLSRQGLLQDDHLNINVFDFAILTYTCILINAQLHKRIYLYECNIHLCLRDTFWRCKKSAECERTLMMGGSADEYRGWKQSVSIIHDGQRSIWNYNRPLVRQSTKLVHSSSQTYGTWAEVPFMNPKQRQHGRFNRDR